MYRYIFQTLSHLFHCRRLGLVSLLLLCSGPAWALQVTASVDKNPVMVGESVTLEVSADDDIDSNAFDPGSLMMANFIVGNTSVSRQTQMINFKTSKVTRWDVTLIPRKSGRYTIPALDINGHKTQPIVLTVIKASAASQQQQKDIFVTTEVDNKKVYLQSQIRYTVKLYLSQDLQRGTLANPTIKQADVRQIGKDKDSNEILNGRRYRVIERTFAIIPQKSGHFTIGGPLFQGEVSDNNASFGFFAQAKKVSRVGPDIDIDVLPVPDNYSYHWLPSDFVQLTEQWPGKNKTYKVGEPVTRILTLTAVGLVQEQLPSINSQYPADVKTYPDQPKTTTVEKDGSLIAQRTENIAIIPQHAGKLTLPAVKVPWFNVLTGKTEFATLPEKTIDVKPGDPSTTPAPPVTKPKVDLAPANSTASQQSSLLKCPPAVKKSWWSISSWIFLGLWLITLAIWWLTARSKKVRAPSAPKIVPEQTEVTDKVLNKAIKSADAGQVLKTLTTWLADYCQHPHQSLAASQQQLNNEQLNLAIANLLASRYSANPADWDRQQLRAAINQLMTNASNNGKNPTQLTPLYPE